MSSPRPVRRVLRQVNQVNPQSGWHPGFEQSVCHTKLASSICGLTVTPAPFRDALHIADQWCCDTPWHRVIVHSHALLSNHRFTAAGVRSPLLEGAQTRRACPAGQRHQSTGAQTARRAIVQQVCRVRLSAARVADTPAHLSVQLRHEDVHLGLQLQVLLLEPRVLSLRSRARDHVREYEAASMISCVPYHH